MLNDLNILIGIEIELKIRGSTLPLFINKTYYLTISFYYNCISILNSLFLGKITKLFDQCFCRVTNCSPHLDGNKKWAQQAQYNKFVREWVKELG